MSNTIHYECANCICLMDEEEDDEFNCPKCTNKFNIVDGSDYADCGNLIDSIKHGVGKCDCEFDEEDE